jgi:hypothetical protein
MARVQAIPSIVQEFDSANDMGWYGSAFLLAKYLPPRPFPIRSRLTGSSCAVQPLSGKIYTCFETKVRCAHSPHRASHLALRHWEAGADDLASSPSYPS